MTSKGTSLTAATKKQTAKVAPITVDMSKRIEDMSAPELKAYQKRLSEIAKEKAEAEKMLKAQQKKEDESEKPLEPVVFIDESGLIQVPLAALNPLDDGVFPDGEYAMRKIDPDHSDRLYFALQNGDELPPMIGTLTNYGLYILDGNHRWDAYVRYMKLLMHTQGRLSTLDPERYTEEDKQAIADEMHVFMVWVDEVVFPSTTDAIDFAFQANMKHGLPTSQQSRARYGLWLFKRMQDLGTPITLREAARRVGVKHQTLTVTRDRMLGKKKHPKMVDTLLSEEDEEFLEESREEVEKDDRTVDLDEKHIKNLIAAGRYFLEQDWIHGFTMEKSGVDYIRPKVSKCTRDEMVALGTVVTTMAHLVNEHMKEQPALPMPKQEAGQLQ